MRVQLKRDWFYGGTLHQRGTVVVSDEAEGELPSDAVIIPEVEGDDDKKAHPDNEPIGVVEMRLEQERELEELADKGMVPVQADVRPEHLPSLNVDETVSGGRTEEELRLLEKNDRDRIRDRETENERRAEAGLDPLPAAKTREELQDIARENREELASEAEDRVRTVAKQPKKVVTKPKAKPEE